MSCGNLNPVVFDCNDINSVIIQAILNLRGQDGSVAQDILNEVSNICEGYDDYTINEFERVLRHMVRTGILAWGSTTTYMINSSMAQVNPANIRYWRCPGIAGSFYTCNRGNN